MLKLLIRLWLIRKRRNFRWRAFFMALYVYVVGALLGVATFLDSGLTVGELQTCVPWQKVVPVVAALILPVDVLVKLFFKRDTALPDAYIHTRPIASAAWNRFILFSNVLDFWNLNWALPAAVAVFLVLPPVQALLCGFVFLGVSLVNGLVVTTLRKADGWSFKLPVVLAFPLWFVLVLVWSFNPLVLPWHVHLSLFVALCVLALCLVMAYLGKLKSYNELRRRVGNVGGASVRSLYAMEFRAFRRSGRLRAQLVLPFLIVLQAYLYLPDYSSSGNPQLLAIVPLATMSLALIYLQVTFAVEGNFFDGLWTKPVGICRMLLRKYYFAMPLTLAGALCMVPACFLYHVPPFFVLSCVVFCIGACNLLLLAYCFTNKRLSLFESGFMNMRGATFSVSSFALAVCVILFALLPSFFLTEQRVYLFFNVSGLLGLALHRPFIRRMAHRYECHRHEYFERYRE